METSRTWGKSWDAEDLAASDPKRKTLIRPSANFSQGEQESESP
jgi:hypothetical protein